MPIVYVHGAAVRDHRGEIADSTGDKALDNLLKNVTWPVVEKNLRKYVAPALSQNPDSVVLSQAYWGDLGARLAWNGASSVPDQQPKAVAALPHPVVSVVESWFVSGVRYPLNQFISRFVGDVLCYIGKRGTADQPGPIPMRVLTTLLEAQNIKEKSGEPMLVVSNSIGCEIVYDIVTYFLPHLEQFSHIKIDYWCGVASQVGLFEELKLFLNSSDSYCRDKNNRVPFPDRRYLGEWWNVWDVDDVISYSVADIIEDVDDTPFPVGKSLLNEHVGYLEEEKFYKTLAERVGKAFSVTEKEF